MPQIRPLSSLYDFSDNPGHRGRFFPPRVQNVFGHCCLTTPSSCPGGSLPSDAQLLVSCSLLKMRQVALLGCSAVVFTPFKTTTHGWSLQTWELQGSHMPPRLCKRDCGSSWSCLGFKAGEMTPGPLGMSAGSGTGASPHMVLCPAGAWSRAHPTGYGTAGSRDLWQPTATSVSLPSTQDF